MKTKILIDTDLGDDIDDAFAIAMALGFEDVDILGLTTVFKNTKQRAYIAKRLLTLFKRDDIPVYAGINKPLAQEAGKFAIEQVGNDNLPILRHFDEKCLDYPYEGDDAIDFIIKTVKNNPNEVILFGIGPATNIASAIQKDPETMKQVKQIILMNGMFDGTDNKEWNVLCDPEATNIVYSSKIPLKSIGANCTRLVQLKNKQLSTIENLKSPGGKYLDAMLAQWRKDNNNNCPIMHDALALISIVKDYCRYRKENIVIPLNKSNRGCTLFNSTGNLAEVSTSVNVDGFLNDFVNRIREIDEKNQ